MSKKDFVLGVDIGSHSLKVCQLKYAARAPRVVALGSTGLPEDVVADGNLEQPDAVAEALTRLLKNLKIRNKRVGFSVSGYSVIVKRINLPMMEKKELEEYITAEAEQYIPFDIDDVYLDYQDLNTGRGTSGRTDVMLVAAKKDVVDSYLQMFSGLKLTPVLVDIDGFAFGNSYEFTHSLNTNVALIDIGAVKMNINILANGVSFVARDVMIGSNTLTEDISDALDVDFDVAEDIKLGRQRPEGQSGVIEEVFLNTCTQWVLEIKKAVDLYHSNNPQQPLKKIVLAGGGAKVAGFVDFLARETGLPVSLFNPFASFDFDRKKIDPAYLKAAGPEMAIATGIALRHSVI